MEVTYKNTIADLFYFCFFESIKQRGLQLYYVVFIFLVEIVIIDATLRTHFSLLGKLLTIAVLTFVLLLIFSVIVLGGQFRSLLGRWKKYYSSNMTIYATNGSIIQQTPFNKSEIHWKGIDQIRQSRKYIFIYMLSMGALIIPKASFQDENKAEIFLEYILENWSRGQSAE